MHVKFRHHVRINIRCALFRMTAIFQYPCVNWILSLISINTVPGKFRGIQFLHMGDLQRFRDLIFADERSRDCNVRLCHSLKPSQKRQQSVVLSSTSVI